MLETSKNLLKMHTSAYWTDKNNQNVLLTV